MNKEERKSRTDLIRIVWTAIKLQKSPSASASKCIKYISINAKLSEEETEQLLSDAVDDGLLEVSYGIGGPNRTSKKSVLSRTFRIPIEDEISIKDMASDLYCFECHTSKSLEKCSACPRVFHEHCMRSALESLAEPVETDHSQNIDDSALVEPAETAMDDTLLSLENSEEKPSLQNSLMKEEIPTLTDETTADVQLPIETKDVICIGEIRPPSRRRKHLLSSYKDNQDLNLTIDEYDIVGLFCTSCWLQKKPDLRNPPNMQAEEMNYLLKFIFNRIKSWISGDTYAPLQFSTSIPMPSKQEFDFFEKKCLKFFKTFEFIHQKLKDDSYNSFTEFQCDILDIKHCIGILYGVQSAEYEACKYLVADCSFEMSEIHKCRDCYRHSNEKSNEFWFCKPCVPRHELVFAKQIGYCHWPAKVIRFHNNKYDVRFFGNKHSRALIDAASVKPIDIDMKLLKIKRNISFNKAMDELHMHQELLQWPPGRFSYETERTNPLELPISPKVINRSMKTGKGKKLASNPPVLEENETTQMSSVLNLTTEIGSSEDFMTPSGKRKKNMTNVVEHATGDSMNASFIAKKKAKTTNSSTPQSAKGKRKRKSTVKQHSSMNSSNSSLNKNQMEEDEVNGREVHTNGQESEVSSTQDFSMQQISKTSTPSGFKAAVEKRNHDVVETLSRELLAIKCSPAAKNLATETLTAEIDRWETKLTKLVEEMTEEHKKAISESKKCQWCYHCENEAIYHCCWNTAYCSTECQKKHWQIGHKNTCRRKRLAD